jgi:DNA-binding NtrC family response regulator
MATAPENEPKTKILLIDNDQTFIKALTALLLDRRNDLTVETAATAESALLLIGVTDYDVILSDLRMPGMDGFELLRESKLLRPDTPVVLITGYGDRAVEEEAMRQGAYALLHKPIDPEVLLSVVGRAVLKGRLLRRGTELYETLTNKRYGEDRFDRHREILDRLSLRNEVLRKKIQHLVRSEHESH